MIHVRVVVPESALDPVLADLESFDAVHNLVVFPGACRRPDGDLIQFDVAREATNDVLSALRLQDVHRIGSITIDRIDLALSDAATPATAQHCSTGCLIAT